MTDNKLQFLAVYVPECTGEYPSHDKCRKVNNLISLAVDKFRDFAASSHPANSHLALEFTHVLAKSRPVRKEMQIQILVSFVNKQGEMPKTTGYVISLPILNTCVAVLPDNDCVFTSTNNHTHAFEWLMNCVLHEMCHSLGAQHSGQGLMSGWVPLFDFNKSSRLTAFDLSDLLDQHTSAIIAHGLHKRYADKDLWAGVEWDLRTGFVEFRADKMLSGIYFLKNTKYTKHFYNLFNPSTFICPIPETSEWDEVLVVMKEGPVTRFAKPTAKCLVKSRHCKKVLAQGSKDSQ